MSALLGRFPLNVIHFAQSFIFAGASLFPLSHVSQSFTNSGLSTLPFLGAVSLLPA